MCVLCVFFFVQTKISSLCLIPAFIKDCVVWVQILNAESVFWTTARQVCVYSDFFFSVVVRKNSHRKKGNDH